MGGSGGGGSGSGGGDAGPRTLVITPRNPKEAPLRKLTTGLLYTYKLINTRYYEAKKARQAKAAGIPNAEDYTVTVGDMLGHFRVEESMGKGSFGQVVSAVDTRTGTKVAVKVIKNKEAFRRQARTEIKLLELLNRKDPDDQWCLGEWECVVRGCVGPDDRGCVVVRCMRDQQHHSESVRTHTYAPPAHGYARHDRVELLGPHVVIPAFVRVCPMQSASWSSSTTVGTPASCLSTCPSICTSC